MMAKPTLGHLAAEREEFRERIIILEELCGELWDALISARKAIGPDALHDPHGCILVARRHMDGPLANAEQINRILEEVDQQERDDNGQFGAGA